MRSAFDFTPLFRSTVGFDRIPNLLEMASRVDEASLGYPPYDIEKLDDDSYRITMSVAGFALDDLEIETRDNTLVVSGKQAAEEAGHTYLHRGIAARTFQRTFQLADHVKVNGASLANGLLHIDLAREVPEEMKPRTIPISGSATDKITEKTKKLFGSKEKQKAA